MKIEENKYPYNILSNEYLEKYINELHSYYDRYIRRSLTYKGINIYFGNHKNEFFLFDNFIHIGSFGDDFKPPNVYIPNPCRRYNYNTFCQNCIEKNFLVKCKNEHRAWCLYRLKYLKYVRTIFLNIKSNRLENIEIYETTERKVEIVHIRYKEEDDDFPFYVRLEKNSGAKYEYYSFICAYPLFQKGRREYFNALFGKIKKEK
jgi:hypothetical protein